MRVSIIVPSYNQGRFLSPCLNSIVRQLNVDDELFVVDGGSSDESVDVIRGYSSAITKWVSERDGGQACAVNKGLQWATGDVIVWVNSDDALMPGSLELIRRSWRPNDRWLVFGSVWTNVAATKSTFFPAPRSLSIEDFMDGAMPVNQPSCVISRMLLNEVGGIDESLCYALDYDLMVKCMRITLPRLVNRPLGINRIHGETKSSQREKMTNELSRVAVAHFGVDARRYPRGLFAKYKWQLITKYGLSFLPMLLMKRFLLRVGLPGVYRVGLARQVGDWLAGATAN